MAIVFSAKQISKTFGARPLFDGVSFTVESDDRIGLIGPNGAGKSTLLRIMSGEINTDTGNTTFQRGLKIGFLEQNPLIPKGLTVEQAIREAIKDPHNDSSAALAGELLSKLELSPIADKMVETLSGGWRKRVALARELAKEPDLLLLDEPTNHLDVESILWLEEFLAKSRFAVVTVTHDRVFLQRSTNRIVELDRRNPDGMLSVRGDYATYLEQKETMMSLQQREETVLKNTLRRETEWLRRGAKARTTKQQARIHAASDLQEKVEELEYRNQNRSARIEFQSSDKKPKRLIEAQKITKSLGGRTLFKDLDLFIGPGSRVGLLGTNGCGKSTLIRVLLGEAEPDSGTILRSDHLKVAYFEQSRETLDPTVTLRKTLAPHGDQVNYRGKLVHINGYLDRFLFRKEQIDMVVGRLSGGEQARVLIARLMQQEANVLVLDEPTNDLDVQTLNVLQDCLTEFDGAVLLVTHDRYFLDQVATEILAFPSPEQNTGKLISFSGLHQWENWRQEQNAPKKAVVKNSVPPATKSSPKKKLGFNETRELAGMEKKIEIAENKLRELENQSQLPENVTSPKKLTEIFQGIAAAQLEIETLYARWAELEAMSS